MTELLVVGAGGHGRELVAIAFAMGRYEIVGVVSEAGDPDGLVAALGLQLFDSNERLVWHDGAYALGVGDPVVRRRLDGLAHQDARPAELVHPTAVIGPATSLGPGFVAFPYVAISTNVAAGRHVHVNVGSTISHDCVVGDFVTLSPGCHVSGNVRLEDDVTLGVGAVVRQGVTIGRGSFVGAGAVVVSDLPPGVVAFGVPARPTGAR